MRDNNWQRSSLCTADKDQCVEVLRSEKGIFVQDSKNEGGPVLSYTHEEWAAFVAGVKAGEFDVPGDTGDVEVESVTTAVPEPV